jgi:ribosomal subunit interface protein
MQIKLTTRHCTIPERLRERARDRMMRLKRYEPELLTADVVFEFEDGAPRVDVLLTVPRKPTIYAHATGNDFNTALDRVLDRVRRQIRRRRTRSRDHRAAPPLEVSGERLVAP